MSASSTASTPYPLGVSLVPGGVNVAVYSETADSIDFCVFTSDREVRTTLTERTGYVFHAFIPKVGVGARYGLRVAGAWDPSNGLRHNANKLLLDPYARAIEGSYTWNAAMLGHEASDPSSMNSSDSASFVPRCLIVDTAFDWGDDQPPDTALADTIVYETHVKGFTQRHPLVPLKLRGTYAGLAHPAAIDHLVSLGVTAIELMPTHQFVQDGRLLDDGLRNYWGYNSIGFFAPHADYRSSPRAGRQVEEFKSMVKSLHSAGLEVIMDVVYNHTAEGNELGPTLSFKGIDNAAYYRLVDGHEESYFDTTGTGNSLNVGHPAALGLIMDSLRYWVTDMHVDGFRFDLATTLTRQGGDAELHSAFLDLVAQDPVLARVKKIAEPWDLDGYEVGGFPADWSEWNGKFRDDVRDFWQRTDGVLGTLSQRILGSPDVYQRDRRSPLSSINFVTAHDGFTLRDLTSYEQKHNGANGEDNRDGSDDNRSTNGGVEGPTDDPEVLTYRGRHQRNLVATLLLSAGVPLLLGGDELGRTQAGNNNAYCQDNEISWYDWQHVDQSLLDFTTSLIRLRKENAALRPLWFREDPSTGNTSTVQIFRSDGGQFGSEEWDDPDARSVTFVVAAEGADTFALLLNSAANGVEFALPTAPGEEWVLAATSDPEQEIESGDTTTIVRDASFTLLRSPYIPLKRVAHRTNGTQ